MVGPSTPMTTCTLFPGNSETVRSGFSRSAKTSWLWSIPSVAGPGILMSKVTAFWIKIERAVCRVLRKAELQAFVLARADLEVEPRLDRTGDRGRRACRAAAAIVD